MVELGFIVVIIEGRGTSERSKPYHDYSYGQLEDNGSIEDHIHVIKNLSETRKYMNINCILILKYILDIAFYENKHKINESF